MRPRGCERPPYPTTTTFPPYLAVEVKDFCISQGLLWNTKDFFLIFIFRAFSVLHFTTYADNACVAKTTKFGELRKLLPTNDAQGNPTRGTAQARSRGPSPFRGRAHPRSRGGPRAAKMGTKICYQGSWASQIASHEWVLKFVIKVVGLRKLLPTNGY